MERQSYERFTTQGLTNITKKIQGFFLLTNLHIFIWDHVVFNNINVTIDLHYILQLVKNFDLRPVSQGIYYSHYCPHARMKLGNIM